MDEINKFTLTELFYLLKLKLCSEKEYVTYYETIDIENIYLAISNYYFNETGNKENIDENFKLKLYQWCEEKSRYDLLNHLIIETIKRLVEVEKFETFTLDKRDLFLFNNFESLHKIMEKQIVQIAIDSSLQHVEISKINKNDYHKIIVEIIKEIDPTLEFLKIYNQLLKEKKIIYLNELKETEKQTLLKKYELKQSNLCIGKGKQFYILLNLNGNIEDISSTLHEFGHYLCFMYSNNNKFSNTLSEYISIFFELYGLYYLYKNGYGLDEIKTINSYRLTNTYQITIYFENVFSYISTFLKDKEIKEVNDVKNQEGFVSYLRNILDTEVLKKIKENNPEFLDAKILAHLKCDDAIDKLIKQPLLIYKTYPYILGNYLADETIKIIDKKETLKKLKYFINNISSIVPNEVFNYVGCQIEENDKKMVL